MPKGSIFLERGFVPDVCAELEGLVRIAFIGEPISFEFIDGTTSDFTGVRSSAAAAI